MQVCRILFIGLIVAVCEGCHLRGLCRKRRDVDLSQQSASLQKNPPVKARRSIHGGCAARMLDVNSGLKETFTKYGLNDESINNELAMCVSSKMNPVYLKWTATEDINKHMMIHYYFMFNWLRFGKECKDHTAKCAALNECINSMLRRSIWRSYWMSQPR